eukprot:1169897-Prorocentrum_minimum.AAC.1
MRQFLQSSMVIAALWSKIHRSQSTQLQPKAVDGRQLLRATMWILRATLWILRVVSAHPRAQPE